MQKKTCLIVIFLSLFLALLQEQVFAHYFAYYASTPVTPPADFLWWLPISALLLVIGTSFPLRMSLKWSRLYSLIIALLWVIVFSVIFFLIGSFEAGKTTAPPPGLGFPSLTYWGRTFSEVGFIFLFWNVLGLLLLMSVPVFLLFKFGKKIEKPKRFAYWSWIMTIPLGFALGVAPYIAQGAWVHGWRGSYVMGRCHGQIEGLHYALVMYALDNENHLPVAKDFAELHPQIESYLREMSYWQRECDVCVIGKAWERTPQSFIWNEKLSGKEVFRGHYDTDLDDVDNPVVTFEGDAILISGKPWVNCPYVHQDICLPIRDIRNIGAEKFERLRNYKELLPQDAQ